MIQKPHNQKGLTLVEILVTIVILAIVSVIISSILFSGLRVSNDAKNVATLQQEANYIIAVLKEQHEQGDPYTIQTNAEQSKITVTVTQAGNTETDTIGSGIFIYKIIDNDLGVTATDILKINPGNNDFYVQLEISRRDDPSKSYTITTILSRL